MHHLLSGGAGRPYRKPVPALPARSLPDGQAKGANVVKRGNGEMNDMNRIYGDTSFSSFSFASFFLRSGRSAVEAGAPLSGLAVA